MVAQGDVEQAFDKLSHENVAEALLARRVHPKFIAAYLFELSEVSGAIRIPGARLSDPFPYNCGAKMGGVEGPDHFNQVVDLALAPVAARWTENGQGFRLDDDELRPGLRPARSRAFYRHPSDLGGQSVFLQ